MLRLSALFVALMLLAAPAVSANQTAEKPSEAAMLFAGGFSNDQLSGMLSRIGARQPPLLALGQMDGSTLSVVFDAAIADAVKKYGPQWQQNMALAWTPLLNEEELASLTTMGAQSPHVEKYLGLREQAGQNMQKLSGDLFRDILQEVIGNTLKTLGADQPAQ